MSTGSGGPKGWKTPVVLKVENVKVSVTDTSVVVVDGDKVTTVPLTSGLAKKD